MSNRIVLKYALDPTGGGQHAIPEDSRFLSLQMQGAAPVMWWTVPQPAGEPREWLLRTFTVASTGPPGYTANLHYVGTFQLGSFVGHVLSHEPVPREDAE